MGKYIYPAGMTEAEKKTLRRKQRAIDKDANVFVPYGGQVTLDASLLTQSTPRATAQGTVNRPTSAQGSIWAVKTVKDFMTLLATGAEPSKIARVTDPRVLQEYREIIMLLGLVDAAQGSIEDQEDQEDQEDTEDQGTERE